MQNTATGIVINWGKAMGVAMIATKVDIPSAIFFLFFFSFIHSLIILHYSRKAPDKKDHLGFIDFGILTIIALGSGTMFTLFGIISGRDEITIYLFGIVGSLLGIKGINSFVDFFWKKLGINLSDNINKWKWE